MTKKMILAKKILSTRHAAALASDAETIMLAGCAGEPLAIINAIEREPDLWVRKTIIGTFIPGVNDRDFSALGMGTTVRSIFATPGLRVGKTGGILKLMPLHYSTYWDYLSTPGNVDMVFMVVPPPRGDGTIGFGINADFTPAPIGAGARLVGIINEAMPDVANGPRLPLDRFQALVEDDRSLPIYDPGALDADIARIAEHIVALLRPGDTIQLGLGKVQSAVLETLTRAPVERLALHSGMISTPMQSALDMGLFSEGVTTGVALGTEAFYRFVGQRDDIRFSPVGFTHAQRSFMEFNRFISINSVLEIDLHGQANGEFIGGRQISGHGGMVDFVRGTRQSKAGLSVLALPSTGKAGAFSRIVAGLNPAVPVTVSRSDVDLVVTEHGIADLRYADVEERARRLIAVADPAFREELHRQWKKTP